MTPAPPPDGLAALSLGVCRDPSLVGRASWVAHYSAIANALAASPYASMELSAGWRADLHRDSHTELVDSGIL